jgi:hypothetical protein
MTLSDFEDAGVVASEVIVTRQLHAGSFLIVEQVTSNSKLDIPATGTVLDRRRQSDCKALRREPS